ncbi:MAG: hypothetical protein HYT94_04335 [Parcubacteria group bacterium]|nr:hypothetical protein [Parcubacteria group bacterium]
MKRKIIKAKKLNLPLKKMPAKEKDYVAGLMENYNGNLEAIFEVLGDLRKISDSHTEMIGGLMVDMTVVKEDVKGLKSEIKEVKSELKGVQGEIKEVKGELKTINERLARIEQTIKEMKDEIKELKGMLKNKADMERVALLETRLYRVEQVLQSHA